MCYLYINLHQDSSPQEHLAGVHSVEELQSTFAQHVPAILKMVL